MVLQRCESRPPAEVVPGGARRHCLERCEVRNGMVELRFLACGKSRWVSRRQEETAAPWGIDGFEVRIDASCRRFHLFVRLEGGFDTAKICALAQCGSLPPALNDIVASRMHAKLSTGFPSGQKIAHWHPKEDDAAGGVRSANRRQGRDRLKQLTVPTDAGHHARTRDRRVSPIARAPSSCPG